MCLYMHLKVGCGGETFVANATVVMSSFTVFLEMVCHVGSSQELAANFAGDFVLVACKVRAETISCGKRGITNLALVGSLCCVYLFDMSIQVVWS